MRTVLRSRAEVDAAVERLRDWGLPDHGHVAEKSWDLVQAIDLIRQNTTTAARILDAGANVSPILDDLVRLGYRDLWAVDIVASRRMIAKRWVTRSPIRFRRRDMTRTGFADASFDAISCLSVIEHGVDLGRFWAEMSRLLRPGGILAVSTDYWCAPIDTTGLFPYGPRAGQMRVFEPDDVRSMLRDASSVGLEHIEADDPLDLACGEPLVRWMGKEYTFAFLPFRRTHAVAADSGREW